MRSTPAAASTSPCRRRHTADVYSFGESEEIVGKALAQTKRHKVVLATKVHGPMGQDPNSQGQLFPAWRWIMDECEPGACAGSASTTSTCIRCTVRRRTPTSTQRRLGALTDLDASGQDPLLRQLDVPGSGDRRGAVEVAERRSRERFVTEQPPYSMLVRGIERDVLPTCQRYGMGVLSVEPAGGRLAGSGVFGPGKENYEPALRVHARPLQHRAARATRPSSRRWRS